MENSRPLVIAAGAVSLAASLFAIGAAVSSDDSGGGEAAPTATAADSAPAPATDLSATAGPDTPVADTTAGTAVVTTGVAPGSEASSGSVATAGEVFDIEIVEFAFGPAESTVSVGTEVVWTNNDSAEHNIVFVDSIPEPPGPTMAQGDTYSVTFTEPGTYSYICGFHPQMTGTIVVEA